MGFVYSNIRTETKQLAKKYINTMHDLGTCTFKGTSRHFPGDVDIYMKDTWTFLGGHLDSSQGTWILPRGHFRGGGGYANDSQGTFGCFSGDVDPKLQCAAMMEVLFLRLTMK